jgi:hypothetical protein
VRGEPRIAVGRRMRHVPDPPNGSRLRPYGAVPPSGRPAGVVGVGGNVT